VRRAADGVCVKRRTENSFTNSVFGWEFCIVVSFVENAEQQVISTGLIAGYCLVRARLAAKAGQTIDELESKNVE
jgi:hypothetical protein